MTTPTMLDKVRSKLSDRKGRELIRIGASTGMSYDTLRRIRDGLTDPPYSKVQQLAAYFSVVRRS